MQSEQKRRVRIRVPGENVSSVPVQARTCVVLARKRYWMARV
jgi:hypothetical protein